MIPKVIHYCWFGKNPLNDLSQKCISSWKKYCPDYEIIEWNEDNFDINCNTYVKEAYESKKWAFVTDYVRLYALDKFGGIYMDTDVELLKPIDEYLVHTAFSGFETEDLIPTAIMGSVKEGAWIKHLLTYYDNRHFILPDGTQDKTTNVITITKMTVEKYKVNLNNEFQSVDGVLTLYPRDFFCPKDYHTAQIELTDNTVCIHHFNASWFSKEEQIRHERYVRYVKKYGTEKAKKIVNIIELLFSLNRALKHNGVIGFSKKLIFKTLGFIIKRTVSIGDVLFFETEGDFADNGRALYDYLIKNDYNKKYRIIWSVKKKKRFVKKKAKNVRFISKEGILNSLIHLYYINRAKYFFFTHPYWLKKWKDGQTVINLWHGLPIKGQGADLSDIYDIALVSSEASKPLFSKFIGAKEEQMLVIGNPRTDLMFKNKDIFGFLEKYTGKGKYKKIILSMPTFRQGSVGKYEKFENKYSINSITTEEDLKRFNEYLRKNDMLLIAKVHHLQNLDFLDCTSLSNVLYLTDEDLFENDVQLYELVGHADCLLTDFSSIYFDFLLLNRPIGFFIADLHEYSRGFLVENPLEYMPGKKIHSNEDLYQFLDDLINDIDTCQEDRKRILDFAYKYQDEFCCSRLVEFLKL